LEERTAELAVAKELAETANQQLEAQNLQLQYEIIIRRQVEEEQRRNMEQLRLSEERFVKIFHNSPIVMSIITPDEERYIDVNKKWEETTGYRRQEIIGRSFSKFAAWAEINQLPEASGEFDETGVKKDAVITMRTRSGETRTMLLSRTMVNLNNEDCWLTASVDITERKKMEQEMARLDRLNLVGEMAASIGHEIRNPMTTVRGYLQFLQQNKNYHQENEYFELMIEELDSANAIITEFLSLAKDKTVERTPININTIIGRLLPLVQAKAMSKDQHIKVKMGDLPDLLLDDKEIRQLILNLVNNGMEAMAGAGDVNIRTFMENGNVVLSVRDQGNGIDPKLLGKIGTPFFTTKEQGTGLGLAVCYRIANRHNAKIDIDTGSTGTTFYVRLPSPLVPAAGR
ncbi:MAG: ATP-binding protein, partial [Syntrophomonas sp.]